MLRAGLAAIIARTLLPTHLILATAKAQQPACAAKAAEGGRNAPCRTCCYHSPHAPTHTPNSGYGEGSTACMRCKGSRRRQERSVQDLLLS